MVAKRQHIIPRFLQKGFASRFDGSDVFTWAYRKGKKDPFETNTINSYVETFFFGKDNEVNADYEITRMEGEFLSPLVNRMRDKNCDFAKERDEIVKLISHFSLRTKHLRMAFVAMSEKALDGFKNLLTDDQVVEDVLLNPSPQTIKDQVALVLEDDSDPQIIQVKEIFENFGIEKQQVADLLGELTSSFLLNEETKAENKAFIKTLFSGIFEGSLELVPESIKKGQIQTLKTGVATEPKAQKYKHLEWGVFETGSPLILGDIAFVTRTSKERLFKPSTNTDDISEIFFPISTNQILIGSINLPDAEINVEEINKAIAKCSFEQFIFHTDSNDKRMLMELIGLESYISSDEEIDKEMEEIRRNIDSLINDRKED